jgi:hypothetical protein
VRGVLSGKYVFRTTMVEENLNNLKTIVVLVRRANPNCKFVFSPVPPSTLEPNMYGDEDGTAHHVSERVVQTIMGHFLRLYMRVG